ncbi:hypothetical protein TVAG_186090 [Trichomonas vaginalis G3]|uniref:Glycosyltransferase 61 catalytic domain-containing protein n=1 Tax=Trichomonas vaginalis (strain ATCC PRA-98 / G3) TaxID=412133 RepID=A2D8Q2_TRIV3|nr:glycosyltransferase family [Trichomonas vaginalis G3]EAY23301.1 hypothetical protein TVAG_186090 [Trichomonas vaginalis G3]KAI5534046.1 glycosyltransferase family [Trichomonas vaginalis G3]|eukprot:XP_001584287.1 hypothetical protein [Trichomonas vaginalis G3]
MLHYVQYWHMYGHYIHDFLSSMMFVPQELMEKGILVASPKKSIKAVKDLVKYLGLNITFLKMKKDEQIYVKKLWIVHTLELGHGYASGGFTRMRKLIMEKVDFNKIKPTRFVLADRPPKSGRNFENPKLMLKYLNDYTVIDKGCKWVRDDKFFGVPVEQIVKYWQSIKVLVTLQGSGIYNAIFMHEKCGMCLVFSSINDGPNLHLCTHLHIFLIGVIHPRRAHKSREPQVTNYTLMVQYTQRVVDTVNQGNWTSMEGIHVFLKEAPIVTNVSHFVRNYKDFTKNW